MGRYLKRFTKDPGATLRYRLTWDKWLPAGDTISAAVSTPQSGITVVSTTNTTNTTTTTVSGGTAGTDYLVTVRITTTSGLIDERSLLFAVRDR
jgi:hypothetical protein